MWDSSQTKGLLSPDCQVSANESEGGIVMTENIGKGQDRIEGSPLESLSSLAMPMAAEEEEKVIDTVDDAMRYILGWANRGTMRQFYTMVSAKLSSDTKRDVELTGDTLTFYSVHKEGGILGIGGRAVREPALSLTQKGDMIIAAAGPLDSDFAMSLTGILSGH
jgi:hypothetical protein